MAGVKPRLSTEQLAAYAAKGLDAKQISTLSGLTREAIYARARRYGIELKGSWRKVMKPKPAIVPVRETPPTPALVALAPYDDIARRALERKRGKLVRAEET